jgi:hypothetical protein
MRRAVDAIGITLFVASLFVISAAVTGLWLGLALRFIWVLQ